MPSRTNKHRLLVGGAAALGVLALTFAGAGAASAHVGVSSNTAEAGSYAVLTFSVPHGCGDSPTTSVAIQIPEGINAVTPTRNAFYTVEKVSEALETPIVDGHGNEVTERIAEIVYTATTPLPHDQRDTFELSLQLPTDAAGQTLYFPTVQTCEEGETGWVQIPADGQDPHDLEAPSPALSVVAASDSGHGHGDGGNGEEDGDAHGSEDEHADAAAQQPATASQTPLIVTSLVVGAAGLLTGGIALLRGARRHDADCRRETDARLARCGAGAVRGPARRDLRDRHGHCSGRRACGTAGHDPGGRGCARGGAAGRGAAVQ
ncbi:YcnI family protein [Microbacterium sp. NIBRBAC000506063]|nr:YcnI family protein [Microbacterium sp. NIBRBAC000506063]